MTNAKAVTKTSHRLLCPSIAGLLLSHISSRKSHISHCFFPSQLGPMTSLIPREPYSKEELDKLYPKGLKLQLVQVVCVDPPYSLPITG